MSGRIEEVARVSGRRAWTIEQKLTMLRDAFGPGGSVRASIERHELSSGLPLHLAAAGDVGRLAGTQRPALPSFAEVRVIDAPAIASSDTPSPPVGTAGAGRIVIKLPSGVWVSVDASVDAGALGRVLAVLLH